MSTILRVHQNIVHSIPEFRAFLMLPDYVILNARRTLSYTHLQSGDTCFRLGPQPGIFSFLNILQKPFELLGRLSQDFTTHICKSPTPLFLLLTCVASKG